MALVKREHGIQSCCAKGKEVEKEKEVEIDETSFGRS